jgi:replicative DNA helicase
MDQLKDEATENVVIGSLILNPKEYNSVAHYVTDLNVFSQQRARALWTKLTKMIKKGGHIDLITMCASLTQDEITQGATKGYVVDCTNNACSNGMTETYAQKIYEKYLLRRIVGEAENIQHNVIKHGDDVYKLITNTHSLMGELLRVRPGDKFDIHEVMNETASSMRDGSYKMIKTGFRNIDSFAGGLTRGEITIVGGRPGHGKTTFLVNLLASLIGNGYKVAVFNRELPNTEVMKKILCIEMPKLDYGDVRRGVLTEGTVKLLQKARAIITEKYGEERFVMFDNIRDFPKTASEVKKFKPDVIIDDYIQLITPTGKEDVRRLQLERLVNDYKWLAKENDCAVIMASQLNRSIESRGGGAKRPQLSDLAESGAIEQVAENVFFVYYPYKVDRATHSANEIYLVASKVRYGETGEIMLGYNGSVCTIYDDVLDLTNPGEKNDTRTLPFD